MRPKQTLKRALVDLARTSPGRRALASVIAEDPRLAVELLGPRIRPRMRLAELPSVPSRLERFEDLVFLFSGNQLNRGLASLDIDEAAYLYRLVRSLPPGRLVEIGRYRGGSTLLIAAAMDPGSRLTSYDLHVKAVEGVTGDELDADLARTLERCNLAERVEIVVGDSASTPAPAEDCVLVFVDGDHSYEGVRRDYERWRRLVPPGGHMLFHDAIELHELASADPEVVRAVAEIERDDPAWFVREGGAGSLLHLRRTHAPWPSRPARSRAPVPPGSARPTPARR